MGRITNRDMVLHKFIDFWGKQNVLGFDQMFDAPDFQGQLAPQRPVQLFIIIGKVLANQMLFI
ncbi:MAG: hypothetical protein IPK63_13975 [Candidatus Competibacteraceae bacterium]|nr:hypothetical protein [Candidatus Competibacteraceae bacterium]